MSMAIGGYASERTYAIEGLEMTDHQRAGVEAGAAPSAASLIVPAQDGVDDYSARGPFPDADTHFVQSHVAGESFSHGLNTEEPGSGVNRGPWGELFKEVLKAVLAETIVDAVKEAAKPQPQTQKPDPGPTGGQGGNAGAGGSTGGNASGATNGPATSGSAPPPDEAHDD
jgi:hypothetical protein